MQIQVQKLTAEEKQQRGVDSWPIWERGVSRFDWYYDETEECLLLEGEVKVETESGTVHIEAGDFVTFPRGLSCVWDIRKPVRKHYNFR